MPTYIIKTIARADIWERWEVEADNEEAARELLEDGTGNLVLLEDGVTGQEEDREIAEVEEVGPTDPTRERTIEHVAKLPAYMEFIRMIAALETASEFDERTDDEGMSGDDAVDAISNLIDAARALLN